MLNPATEKVIGAVPDSTAVQRAKVEGLIRAGQERTLSGGAALWTW